MQNIPVWKLKQGLQHWSAPDLVSYATSNIAPLQCCVCEVKITRYLNGLLFARVAIHQPPGVTKSDRLRVQSVALLQQVNQ